MKALEEKILREGKIYPGNILKVGSFLNHQIDAAFLMEMGKEIGRLFAESGITKVMTVEASGIAVAVAAAYALKVPAVFAKKGRSSNISNNVYASKVYSYTHQREYDIMVDKEFLGAGEKVLIVDDFLAHGNAIQGLIEIVHQAGSTVAGISAVIEKGFQGGGDALRKAGYHLESLAVIESMDDHSITYR